MNADVCVIGGGPAGSTLAARLAMLGHDVCLVERKTFPRPRLGESLSPGVLPLLEVTGARLAVEAAGFRPVDVVRVDWERGPTERVDPSAGGLLVDRGRFDRILLDRALDLGVRVLQPARVRSRTWRGAESEWRIEIEEGGRSREIRTSLIADAAGRSGALPSRREPTGPRTFALYAYWTGPRIPAHPTIEAGADEWYWGVPLPGGTYNTLVFLDPERLEGRSRDLGRLFEESLSRSSLLAGYRDVRLVGPVRAVDATPYLEAEPASEGRIKVGDAALAIDPISSSGVQKAVQSALSAAVVVNTWLRRPGSKEAARRFYEDSLRRASERHRAWASGHYAAAGASRGSGFWSGRAGSVSPGSEAGSSLPMSPSGKPAAAPLPGADTPLGLSGAIEFVDTPCIEGPFVEVKRAVRHPGLDEPVAFLGGYELEPLLRGLRPGSTPIQLARSWSARIPPETGLAVAAWLVRHGILVPGAGAEPVRRPPQ